jgi:hypothetical protein
MAADVDGLLVTIDDGDGADDRCRATLMPA